MKTSSLIFGIFLTIATSFAGATTHVVKAGDNLFRIARNHGLSLDALQSANPGVNAQALRIGQRLTIPGRAATAARTNTKATTASRVAVTGTYTVVAGDNLSKIARRQGTSIAALQSANPGLKPDAIHVGQKINVTGSRAVAKVSAPVPTPAPRPQESSPKPAPKLVAKTTPAPVRESAPVVKKAAEPAPISQTVAKENTVNTTTPAPAAPIKETAPVAQQKAPTSYRLIKMTRELTLVDVATEYGTTPDKINSLNGWTFSPQTLLAVDSELYVPAQP